MVQNNTFGTSPPGEARRRRKKVSPSITGMFQSISSTSGMTPEQ